MKHRNERYLSRDRAQLLVIDIQDKLFGVMTPDGQANLKRNVPVLLAAAKEFALPVVVTEQYPKGIGPTIPAIKDELDDAPVFDKVVFSAVEVDEVAEQLATNGRKQVIVCGMETHICVYQSALGLLALGYDVHVVADATAVRVAHNQEIGLKLLENAGATITSTEAVLFQLLERAGGEAFKRLQKLIV